METINSKKNCQAYNQKNCQAYNQLVNPIFEYFSLESIFRGYIDHEIEGIVG